MRSIMNTNSDKKIVKRGRCSSSIPYSLFPIPRFRGVSLMEVLASVFVIGVGLLGVLAVIPFGAFQVSKAQHAEYCSNMLVSAANELQTVLPMSTWRLPHDTVALQSTNMVRQGGPVAGTRYFLNHNTQSNKRYNTTQYLLVDPFYECGTPSITTDIAPTASHHAIVVGAGNGNSAAGGFDHLNLWKERLMGQDDILFTTHKDKRTTLVNDKAISSGRYTWFFMFRPVYVNNSGSGRAWANDEDVEEKADVDILGCYEQTIDNIRTVYARYVQNTTNHDYAPLQNGAMITFRSVREVDLDFGKSKYIFVSWVDNWNGANMNYVKGAWCRIVNCSETTSATSPSVIVPEAGGATVNTAYKRTVTVLGDLPQTIPWHGAGGAYNNVVVRGMVIDGVLYHKKVPGVTIK